MFQVVRVDEEVDRLSSISAMTTQLYDNSISEARAALYFRHYSPTS